MLSWFINKHPLTYLNLMVFFIGLYLIMLYFRSVPVGQAELVNHLVAQNLANGQSLYLDVKTNLAPLGIGVQQVLYIWLGDSRLIYQLLALVLLLVQASFFHSLLENSKAFKKANYFPFWFYLLWGHLNFDLYHLSPFLLGQTCFMGALWLILPMPKTDSKLVYVGILMAIASLMYQMFIVFNLFFIYYILVNSKVKPLSNLGFFLYGFLSIGLGVGLYFGSYQDLNDVMAQYFYLFEPSNFIHYDWNKSYLLGWSVLTLLIVLFSMIRNRRFKSKDALFFTVIILTLAGFFLFPGIFTPSFLLLLALPFSYFYIALIFTFKKNSARIVCFYLGVTFILGFNYANHNSIFAASANSRFIMKPKTRFKHQSILVLGSDLNYYSGNRLGGAYLNWDLSKRLFKNLDQAKNLIAIAKQFERQQPDIIIDLEGYMPDLLNFLPYLNYRRKKTMYYKQAH